MKTLEELNLVDDFLVNSLTSHKIYGEQSARYILECILHRQIGKLTVVPQRFFCGENLETHGIRLDVYPVSYTHLSPPSLLILCR